jgi:energy-coupling factor transport system ATP-binding protein
MAIVFEKVSQVFFDGKIRIDGLKDVSLRIDKGELVGIVGQTGSGKTTLIEHMNLLQIPKKGTVEIDGTIFPSKKMKVNPIRRKVGLVFQFPEYQLFAETVLKDIMYGPSNFKETKQDAKDLALKAAKLFSLSPEILEQSPLELSGGQMRKVAIAGIIAMNPDVLIFDEPTRGLDPKSRQELIDIIKSLGTQGKTIIVVTHDMDLLVELTTRTICLKKGEIAYDGPTRDIFIQKNFKEFSLDYPKPAKLYLELKDKYHLKKGIPFTISELIDLLESQKDLIHE